MARVRFLLGAALALVLLPGTAAATRMFTFEGTSFAGVDVRFTAELTISGDDLTLVLTNDSLNHSDGASPSLNRADLLTSFYFDIVNGGSRPTLSYDSATGDVCLASSGNPYDCSVTTKEDDLRAFLGMPNPDRTWQFKDTFSTSDQWAGPLVIGSNELHFGVGTAGNNSLSPNGFNGNIVDGIDYGIYDSNVDGTASLDGLLLVNHSITFMWTGVNGYTEDDIANAVLFGLGTQPDSTGFVPEPGTGLLLGLGLAVLAARRRR